MDRYYIFSDSNYIFGIRLNRYSGGWYDFYILIPPMPPNPNP